MAEANDVKPKQPEVATVTLSTGGIVAVERWRPWSKLAKMVELVGDLDRLRDLVRGSLCEADRSKADELSDEDCLAVATAAVSLNMTPGLVEGLRKHGEQIAKIMNAVKGA